MITAGWSTPLMPVASVERAIAWYAHLGFRLVDVEGPEGALGWARMHCEGGALMFLRDEGHGHGHGHGHDHDHAHEPPHEHHHHAHDRVALYLYTADLPALREQLAAAGVETGPIAHPPYMASGEMRLRDPDGYTLFVGHWGEAEHAQWLEALAAKRAAGALPPAS